MIHQKIQLYAGHSKFYTYKHLTHNLAAHQATVRLSYKLANVEINGGVARFTLKATTGS
jgi:hypothetical protein